MNLREFTEKDYLIHDREHLDKYLVELCAKIVKGQQKDPKQYGMVAACVLDPKHRMVASTSTNRDGKWSHAERNAMAAYESKYGEIPHGSIILTTLSPCDGAMADRYQGSCTDLINDSPVRKVYCGYMDPSQHDEDFEFTVEATTNEDIQTLCKKFADTFLGDEDHPLDENFADGKHPGRKGLAKRSGVNTKASVSSLRNTAKHSTGEKARMAHWLANMKAGRAKKK